MQGEQTCVDDRPQGSRHWASHPQVAVALPGRVPAGTEPRPSQAAGQTPRSNTGRGPAPRAPPHQLLKHEVGATSAPGPRARHPQEPGSKGHSSPCSSTRVPWSLGELSQQMAVGSATAGQSTVNGSSAARRPTPRPAPRPAPSHPSGTRPPARGPFFLSSSLSENTETVPCNLVGQQQLTSDCECGAGSA